MTFATLLNCPSCAGVLAESKDAWLCQACHADFPCLNGIPWLLPMPAANLAEWGLRLKHLLQTLEGEAETLKQEIAMAAGELTKKRLRKMLQAKVEQRKALAELLMPLAITESGSLALSQGLKVKLPLTQSLTGYYTNIHRDWSWETGENAAHYRCVEEVLGTAKSLGKLLILGAGAGRLAFDIHESFSPELTVATDINPLMLLIAKRMFKGKSLKLHEFPIAPRDLDSGAVLRRCQSPKAAAPGLELVFADVLNLPFKANSFQTILTPWFIDILPIPLPQLLPMIHRMLSPEGVWLNFGSLAFNHASERFNYSFEEAKEIIASHGFTIEKEILRQVPYMQSPASFHGRQETVITFAAKKTGDCPQPQTYQNLPVWLENPSKPIPKTQAIDHFTAVHTIYLDVMRLIDGQRSLNDIALLFGEQHHLSPEEALPSLHNFLWRHYEEQQVGKKL